MVQLKPTKFSIRGSLNLTVNTLLMVFSCCQWPDFVCFSFSTSVCVKRFHMPKLSIHS